MKHSVLFDFLCAPMHPDAGTGVNPYGADPRNDLESSKAESSESAHGEARQPDGGTARRRKCCTVTGCDVPVHGRGLCRKHYRAAYESSLTPRQKPEHCRVRDCPEPPASRGYCQRHYAQARQAGLIAPLPRDPGSAHCKVVGCGRQTLARGYCRRHYYQAQVHGDPEYVRPPKVPGACIVDGCPGTAVSRGLCSRHYAQYRAAARPPCRLAGCDRPANGGEGFCSAHYYRLQRYGDPTATPVQSNARNGEVGERLCQVSGCGKVHRAHGYCQPHYYRWKRYGDPCHDGHGASGRASEQPSESNENH